MVIPPSLRAVLSPEISVASLARENKSSAHVLGRCFQRWQNHPMSVIRGARERARAEVTAAIKEEARRQVAEEGAVRLSLRAVARELGMVSSALYRYFASRDDLLTALITDAYDALGAAAEAALESSTAQGATHFARWQAVCRAVRSWALAHPHEYALVYGS